MIYKRWKKKWEMSSHFAVNSRLRLVVAVDVVSFVVM